MLATMTFCYKIFFTSRHVVIPHRPLPSHLRCVSNLYMINNALLINPWIYDFSAFDYWSKPLGLLSLASLLRVNGISVSLVDCLDPYSIDNLRETRKSVPKRKESGEGKYAKANIAKPDVLRFFARNYNRYGISPGSFLRSVTSIPRPDVIMITSMMTYWYPGVFYLISLLHDTFPGIPVVLGGNYVSLCPSHASTSGADYCLPGPAERSIPRLLKDLFDHDAWFIPDPENLDSYPYPSFDLIDHPVQIPILTSRGCPYRCSYCASHVLNEAFRRRDPIRVVDEIEYWHRHLGICHFSFYDDALLTDHEETAVPLLKEIIRRKLLLNFHCPNGLHLREITSELSKLMFEAGFKTIRFGFETSDVTRQSTTGGKTDNSDFIQALIHLKQAGYQNQQIGVYLLCGLPGQHAEEVRNSIRFVHSCGARPIIAEYSPIPGTVLWNDAIASSPFPIADEPLFQNNSLIPCRNEHLTYEMYQALKIFSKSPGSA